MNKVNDFLTKIFLIIPELKIPYNDLLKYWHPDHPPLTIIMGELARGIDCVTLSHSQEIKLFNLIEEAIISTDKRFADAVATGFLECLFDKYNNTRKVNDEFWIKLGKHSQEFLKGIIDFYQLEIKQLD